MKKTLLGILLLASSTFAKFKLEDIKMDGRLDFGMKDGVTESSEEIYEIEIDLETKRKNGNKLELEVESNNENNEFILNEGFVDREFSSGNRLLFGKGKKILGFEYENPKAKRTSISRSLIYRYVDDFSFVGYDFFASYQWREQDDEGNSKKISALSVHSNQSEDFGLIYSKWLNPDSESWKTMVWTLVQADKARRDYQMVGMIVLGTERKTDADHTSFELFYGKDPAKSEYELEYGDDEEVFFAGLKAEYGFTWEDVYPYTQLSYLAQRIDEPGLDIIQALVGVRVPLDEDLSYAVEFDGRQHSNPDSYWTKYWDESEFKIELRYIF